MWQGVHDVATALRYPLVCGKERNMKTTGPRRIRTWHVFAGILTALVAVMMILPTRALAEESKGQGSSWYAASQADGYQMGTPEQIRAAYYLFATDGQDWWNGSYHAPSEDYVTALIGKPGFTASVIAWKTANFDPTDGEVLDPLGEKDYYEALLFDILYEQSYSVKLLDSLNASLKENKVNLLHTTYKQYRTSFGLDYQLGNGLTYDEGAVVDQCLWDQIVNEGLYGYEAQFKKYLDEVNTMEGKSEFRTYLLCRMWLTHRSACSKSCATGAKATHRYSRLKPRATSYCWSMTRSRSGRSISSRARCSPSR